jgi:hypothetical protein
LGPKTLLLKAFYDSDVRLVTPFEPPRYTSAELGSLEQQYKWTVCTHALLKFRQQANRLLDGDQESARGITGMLQRVPEKYKR